MRQVWSKHLTPGCPLNPKNKGKTTLNYIELVVSPQITTLSKIEQTIPLQVITRAKAKERQDEKQDLNETPSKSLKSNHNSWKARRACRVASTKKQNEETHPKMVKKQPKEILKEVPHEKEKKKNKERQVGLVLVEKQMETLDALLQAYKARLKSIENLEE